eukprot:4206852-Pyramimonas_sp.AAC.1
MTALRLSSIPVPTVTHPSDGIPRRLIISPLASGPKLTAAWTSLTQYCFDTLDKPCVSWDM